MKEIIEMVQMLLKMSTDTYLKCKYATMAASKANSELDGFINALFSMTDKNRPLQIGMK